MALMVFLLKEDSAECLAKVLLKCIMNINNYKYMFEESVKIATKIHNIDNFTEELLNFWRNI